MFPTLRGHPRQNQPKLLDQCVKLRSRAENEEVSARIMFMSSDRSQHHEGHEEREKPAGLKASDQL